MNERNVDSQRDDSVSRAKNTRDCKTIELSSTKLSVADQSAPHSQRFGLPAMEEAIED